jgi:hypothetical protein
MRRSAASGRDRAGADWTPPVSTGTIGDGGPGAAMIARRR